MVLHGKPGDGKSSFGAAVPGARFLCDDQELGINTLKVSGLVPAGLPVLPPASSWLDVLGMLAALASDKHDHKALVIDTLGGMERLCHSHVCQRDFNSEWGDKGFTSYQKGYDVSLPDWREFLNALDILRNERQMSIIGLAHTLVKPFKNPIGEDYDRYVPDMHHKTWNTTHKWTDMVLFANYYVEIDVKGNRSKGKGGKQLFMYTQNHAAYEAKNRHGLPAEISMGKSGPEAWKNLIDAILTARKAVQDGDV